jgi:hypothetical protein
LGRSLIDLECLIALVYCQTDDMPADGLIKILGPTKHLRFVNLLRIKDLPAKLH